MIKRFVFIFLALSSAFAQEKVLTIYDVLKSTRDHAPKVKMAMDKILYYESKTLAAKGGFDSSVDMDYYNRSGVYYDGSSYKAQLNKPLPFLGAKVFTGYKKSMGSFPSYQGAISSLDRGEIMGGVSLSLLRNRDIGSKRLKHRLAQYDLARGQWKQKDLLMVMQQEAAIAYWRWVAEGLKLDVANTLLGLAKERQVAFNKRIKRGDLAAIYASENEQYILKRKSKVAKIEANLQTAALYLSLFYRNNEGRPKVVTAKNLPHIDIMKAAIDKSLALKQYNEEQGHHDGIVTKNFSLQSLKVEVHQLKKQNHFYNTRFLPKLDLKYQYEKDMGAGPKSLYSNDHKIYLSINIPLEYNKIKGNQQANNAMLRLKEREVQFKKEQLNVKLDQLLTKIEALQKITKNTQREVELSLKLEDSERKKFRSGDSDYFVVNIREQNTADARTKLIDSLFDYHETMAQYRAIVMDYKTF